MKDELAGTTAICVIIKDKTLYCVCCTLHAKRCAYVLFYLC